MHFSNLAIPGTRSNTCTHGFETTLLLNADRYLLQQPDKAARQIEPFARVHEQLQTNAALQVAQQVMRIGSINPVFGEFERY